MNKKTFTLDIDKVMVFPITADSATAYTCGTGVEVPTVQSFKCNLEIDSKDLYGSGKIRDTFSKAKKVPFTVEHGELDFDLMNALLGAVQSASGSAPAQVQKAALSLGALNNYFQLVAHCSYTDDNGDVAGLCMHLLKCKISDFTIDNASEEYGKYGFSGSGINTNNQMGNALTDRTGTAVVFTLNQADAAITALVSA